MRPIAAVIAHSPLPHWVRRWRVGVLARRWQTIDGVWRIANQGRSTSCEADARLQMSLIGRPVSFRWRASSLSDAAPAVRSAPTPPLILGKALKRYHPSHAQENT